MSLHYEADFSFSFLAQLRKMIMLSWYDQDFDTNRITRGICKVHTMDLHFTTLATFPSHAR